jgi:hypothetical protein
MTRYFFALSSPIDCMYPDNSDAQTKHAAINAGLFSTLDPDLAAFLQTYPGATLLSSQEETAAIQPAPPDSRPRVIRQEVTRRRN